MQRIKLIIPFFIVVMSIVSAQAAEVTLSPGLNKRLATIFNGQPDRVATAPIDGLLEVTYGTNIFYISRDGRHLINGELFDLDTRINLTKQRLSAARLKVMEDVVESSMIVYPAKGEEKHVITVFTDIDCGYCRKLHKGMNEMNELGITVRYMAYPRAGVNSASYNKAVSVWCSDDRNKAMDQAKNDGKVALEKCADNPVKKQMLTGQKVGVTGTPAIVLENGTLMPGYAPPQKLAAMLEKHAAR